MKLISISHVNRKTTINWNPALKSADVFKALNASDTNVDKLSFGTTLTGRTLTFFQKLAQEVEAATGVRSETLTRRTGFSLENLAGEFGLLKRAHNAGYDARATHSLLKLLHYTYAVEGKEYFSDLVHIWGLPIEMRGEATRALIKLMDNPNEKRLNTFRAKWYPSSGLSEDVVREIVGDTLPLLPGKTELKNLMSKYGYSEDIANYLKLIEKGVIDMEGNI